MDSTLKEKNLLLGEQILSFKSSANFGRSSLFREAYRKAQKLFPFIGSEKAFYKNRTSSVIVSLTHELGY